MFTSISGRSVLVTGASRGIGKGIARVFATAGADVVLAARCEEELQTVVAEFADLPGSCSYVVGDVSDPQACRAMVNAAVERHGGLDVLCANAGVFPSKRLEEMTPTDLEQVMSVNFNGTVFSVQAAIDALTRSGRGRIIITSSITGPVTGYPGWTHYGASKAAQLGFMRTAAMELAKKNITVNAVQPGNVTTEGLDGMGQEYLDQMAAAIPLGRLGNVGDIGNAALFFASEEAGYITGQALIVDGGQVLPESSEAIAEM